MTSEELLIVFYNVENLFDVQDEASKKDQIIAPFQTGSWTNERLDRKLEQIGDALSAIHVNQPILVGLAEVENEQLLHRLCQTTALVDTTYASLIFHSKDKRAMHCGMLYDQSNLELIESENLAVTLKDEPEFTTRDIGYAHFTLQDDQDLHVLVNHWSSRRDGKTITEHRRQQAAKVLMDKIQKIHEANPEGKIIVMGDLNDEPSDSSVQLLIDSSKENGVQLKNLMAKRTEGTLVRQRKWLLFDQMLVSSNLLAGEGVQVKNGRAEIFNHPNLLYTYPNGDTKPNATFAGDTYHGGFSDHLPIYLILE